MGAEHPTEALLPWQSAVGSLGDAFDSALWSDLASGAPNLPGEQAQSQFDPTRDDIIGEPLQAAPEAHLACADQWFEKEKSWPGDADIGDDE